VSEKIVQEVEIDNATMVAFLSLKGFSGVPFISVPAYNGQSSRVSWKIMCNDKSDVDAAIKRFYENEQVGSRDFAKALQEIRSSMYSVKQMNGQLKK
jgi:hypothetical protein